MNAVVQQDSKLPIIAMAVRSAVSAILEIDDGRSNEIAAQVLSYSDKADHALSQAQRATIDSEESFGKGGDLIKAINGQVKSLNADRMTLTKPMDEAKSALTNLFKVGLERFEQAKTLLNDKCTTFAKAERARKEAQAREDQRLAEEKALQAADAQVAMGDQAGADQVLDEAAKVIDKLGDTKVVGRGSYGATIGLRGRWVGRVEDPRAFLAYLSAVTSAHDVAEYVEFRQARLNKLAQAVGTGDLPVPGFKADWDESTSSR